MEVIVHFIFELIKIVILGSVYAFIPFVLIRIIGHFKPNSIFSNASKRKLKLWVYSGLIISFGLLIFMFTYWGNHGLGDNSILPIGHFKTVDYGGHAYITTKQDGQISLGTFTVDSDKLYASSVQKSTGGTIYDFLIWDLTTDEVKYYQTKEEYLAESKLHDFPTPDKFEDFGKHYSKYWHTWKLWLLP